MECHVMGGKVGTWGRRLGRSGRDQTTGYMRMSTWTSEGARNGSGGGVGRGHGGRRLIEKPPGRGSPSSSMARLTGSSTGTVGTRRTSGTINTTRGTTTADVMTTGTGRRTTISTVARISIRPTISGTVTRTETRTTRSATRTRYRTATRTIPAPRVTPTMSGPTRSSTSTLHAAVQWTRGVGQLVQLTVTVATKAAVHLFTATMGTKVDGATPQTIPAVHLETRGPTSALTRSLPWMRTVTLHRLPAARRQEGRGLAGSGRATCRGICHAKCFAKSPRRGMLEVGGYRAAGA